MADVSSIIGGLFGKSSGGSSGVTGLTANTDSRSSQSINPITSGYSSTGAQNFAFGGNPNIAQATQVLGGLTNNPWLILGAVVVAVFYLRGGRR